MCGNVNYRAQSETAACIFSQSYINRVASCLQAHMIYSHRTSFLYSKIGVYRGVPYFSLKHSLWVTRKNSLDEF